MSSTRRCAKTYAIILFVGCFFALLAQRADAQSIPVTFTINPAQSTIGSLGTATGVFSGTTATTAKLIAQFGGGGQAAWSGTINAQVGFDPTTHQPTRFLVTGASITPAMHGAFDPGTWNGTSFGSDQLPANYAFFLPSTVNAAVRNATLSASGTNNFLSGTSFPAHFSLTFTGGTLDLDPGPLGSQSQDALSSLIGAYETDASGNIVWRNVIGTQTIGTHVDNIYDMTSTVPAFSPSPAAPVVLYDPVTGAQLPQAFQNNPTSNSTLTATNNGGNNYNLNLTLATNAVAKFFIGSFEVDFSFNNGNFASPGTANITASSAITLPVLGDANGDGKVTGADYTIWADNFNKFNTTQNALYTQGDFNGDGKVTGADYTIWADHFSPGPASPSFAAVPEPTSLLMALCGALGLVTITWRAKVSKR